jgi:hypothetical protein
MYTEVIIRNEKVLAKLESYGSSNRN